MLFKHGTRTVHVVHYSDDVLELDAASRTGVGDIRDILERSSARETATRVAIGAICQNILKNYNIEFSNLIELIITLYL